LREIEIDWEGLNWLRWLATWSVKEKSTSLRLPLEFAYKLNI